MKPRLLIACDFDGTVTRADTLVEILNRYGDPDWRAIQERVLAGEVSIRRGLELEMGTVRAGAEELRAVLSSVEPEPTFPSFLRGMRSRGIPLVVLSGGFDLCVETVMTAAGLWPVPYLANRLLRSNGSWSVHFPYPSLSCQACGHCKADPIRRWNEQGYTTVFVGNGVTDRCPAAAAALTFAKDELEAWCAAQGIPAFPFRTFDDIEADLKRRGWL